MAETLECERCASTSLEPVNDTTYKCRHCGTLLYLGGKSRRQPAPARGIPKEQKQRLGIAAAIVVLVLMAIGFFFGVSKTVSDVPVETSYTVTKRGKAAAAFHSLTPLPDSIGNLYVVGLYKNTGDVAIETPRVKIELKADDGKIVASSHGYAPRGLLAVGDETPIKVLLTDAPSYHSIAHSVHPKAVSYQKARPKLKITEAKIAPRKSTGYVITGKVKNVDTMVARYAQVIGLVYGEGKTIIAMRSAFVATNELKPGAEDLFKIDFHSLERDPESFWLDYSALAR